MKNILVLLLFVLLNNVIISQSGQPGREIPSKGAFTGMLIDSLDKRPIEYGNIAVYSASDSILITGGISDSQGKFLIDNLKLGKYYAYISFVGYNRKSFSFNINPAKSLYDIGTVSLYSSSYKLDEIVVASESEAFVNHIDKQTINVEKLISAQGGTAADVLQNAPSVNVDSDGNVSIRGNGNVTILIDGKPNGLTELGGGDVLSNIPASSIDKIDIVTNPSAKFDPEGTAGIINIIMKKRASIGLNGVITLNTGIGKNYNASINLNKRMEEFGFSVSYDNRFSDMNGSGNTFRDNYSMGSIKQLSENNNIFRMHSFNSNLDFFLNNYNTLSAGFRFRTFDTESESKNNTLMLSDLNTVERDFTRLSDSEREMFSYNYSLGYRLQTDTPDEEFNIDLSYSDNNMDRGENIDQTELNLNKYYYYNESANTNKRFKGEINYQLPLSKDYKIETGFVSSIKELTTNNDYFDVINGNKTEKTLLRNHFKNDEGLYSVYAILNGAEGDFKYQAGLRGEYALSESELVSGGLSFTKDYFSLYPTIHLMYSLNPTDQLRLSYTRRVDRPNNHQINPFTDYSDSLNIFSGNPNLDPQYINSYEAGFSGMLGTTMLNSVFFLRHTKNQISTITTLEAGGVTKSTFKNLNEQMNYGTELSANISLLKWIRFNASFSYLITELEDNGNFGINTKKDSWSTRLNSTFMLPEDFQLQVFFNYNSPSISSSPSHFGGGAVNAQTRSKEMYFADLAIKKDLFDKKISILFRITDVFNTRKFESTTSALQYSSMSSRSFDSRVYYLGITYRLSPNSKQDERRQQENETEIDL